MRLEIDMKKVTLLAVLLVISSLSAFAQSGGLKGKVRNPKDQALPNITVTVRKDGKDLKSTTTDGKGRFEIRGLSAGTYNLVFEGKGYSAGLLSNVEVKDKVRDLPDRLILTIDKGSQTIIIGSVFNQDGRSVTAAQITLERINGDGSTKKLGEAYTTVSGEFAFRQPEGAARYRINAKYKNAAGSKEIEVDSPAIYRLAITLKIEN